MLPSRGKRILQAHLKKARKLAIQTETIQIEITGLPLGTKTALEEVGRSYGKSFPDYLRGLPQNKLLSKKPFSEILEPIRRSFDESGMSEAELDTLFEAAREQVYQENQRQRQ